MNIFQRIKRFFHREPDFYIGGKENPYIRRWWVIPRNYYFNVYLHNILRDDDDRTHHDHPWWWCSIMLRGAYWEVTTLVEGEDFYFDETTGTLDVFDGQPKDELNAVYQMNNGQCWDLRVMRRRLYRVGWVRFHRPTFAHRLEMAEGCGPCWTGTSHGRPRRGRRRRIQGPWPDAR